MMDDSARACFGFKQQSSKGLIRLAENVTSKPNRTNGKGTRRLLRLIRWACVDMQHSMPDLNMDEVGRLVDIHKSRHLPETCETAWGLVWDFLEGRLTALGRSWHGLPSGRLPRNQHSQTCIPLQHTTRTEFGEGTTIVARHALR